MDCTQKKSLNDLSLMGMAGGEVFEPPVPIEAQWFPRPPVSTAHPSLRRRGLPDSIVLRIALSILNPPVSAGFDSLHPEPPAPVPPCPEISEITTDGGKACYKRSA